MKMEFDVIGDVDKLVSVLRYLSVPFILDYGTGRDILTVGKCEALFCLEIARECGVVLNDITRPPIVN